MCGISFPMKEEFDQKKNEYEVPSSEVIKLAAEQMICWSNEDPSQDPI